jgi:hypothetical protein
MKQPELRNVLGIAWKKNEGLKVGKGTVEEEKEEKEKVPTKPWDFLPIFLLRALVSQKTLCTH